MRIKLSKRLRMIILVIILVFTYFFKSQILNFVAEYLTVPDQQLSLEEAIAITDVNEYKSIAVNDNMPFFSTENLEPEAWEDYSSLDFLGRCGEANAVLGVELMPDGERESISSVKPSGWNNAEYKDKAQECNWDQSYWANRSHLIAWSLAGENANPKNLITGTRSMNLAMLEYELQLLNYIEATDNHVRYRVTPIYEGANLMASGVLMEAYSIEDNGTLHFNAYLPNTQSGLYIDYATGNAYPVDGCLIPTTK